MPNFIPTPPKTIEEIVADQLAEEARAREPKPKQTRHRRAPRKSHKRREIDKLSPRMKDLAEGRLSVDDLDLEELQRGQLRSLDGRFHGPKPHAVPRAFHDAMQRELAKRMQLMFNGKLQSSFDAIVGLMENERTPAREKLAAAQYVMERGIGKIAEKQEITSEVTVFEHKVSTGGFLMDLGEIEEGA